MSTAARAALGAALLIAAIVLFVVLQDGEDDSNGGGYGGDRNAKQVQEPAEQKGSKPSEPALPTITVKNGAPVGGVRTIGVDVGGPAAFRIRSNVSDEIHVHGYEVTEAIPAGKAVTISFSADIEGIFEIELHGSGEQIAELQVSP